MVVGVRVYWTALAHIPDVGSSLNLAKMTRSLCSLSFSLLAQYNKSKN